MRLLLIIVFVVLAGCKNQQDQWKTEYLAAVEKWEVAYSGSDAKAAYAGTLAYAEYLKKLHSDDVPFDAPKVLVWVYPRLGLLAEHLGKKEEAQRYFAMAVRHARVVHPTEPDSKTSEEAFRSALDQMDTPDKVLWRKEPNQPPQTTRGKAPRV